MTWDWRVLSLMTAAAVVVAGCGPTSTTTAPAASMAVMSFRLARLAHADGPTTEVAPARDATQVALLFVGEPMPVDDLIAEIGMVGALDDARRWTVEAPGPEDAGVSGRVVVPIYAVPAGIHILTLWRGDAEVLARFRFRVE